MTACPPVHALHDLVEGRLGAAEVESMHEHVGGCAACSAMAATLRQPATPKATLDAGATSIPGHVVSRPQVATIPARAPTWQPPLAFDEYRLIRMLGRGTSGQVWLAEDTHLDREVAIKFLASGTTPMARERLRREARAIARLTHPNVVTVHRVGEIDEQPYLVSERIDGDPLDRLPRPLPWPQVRTIGLGMARGLAAAHDAGIIHRDIKPANAIMDRRGEVKLLDFGLARLGAEGIDSGPDVLDGTASPALTATGDVLGTPLYMAPEAWRGEPASTRMDVYSLGAVLYELCAGVAPHPCASIAELRHSVLGTNPSQLALRCPGIDPAFAAIVDRCLARDPAARFASGAELRDALEAATALPAPRPRRYRWLAALAIAAVAALVAVVVIRGRASPAPGRARPSVDRSTLRCSGDHWCWDAGWISSLGDIWGTGPRDVWVTGVRGALQHFDGATWTSFDTGVVADLFSVQGLASDDVWAAGDWGTILHWDGRRWIQVASGTSAWLGEILPFATDDAWAVGGKGTIVRWDGIAWRAVISPTVTDLWRIAGVSSRDLWVCDVGGDAIHWDGSRWTSFDLDAPDLCSGIYVAASDDVWVVGFRGLIRHWDGARWSKIPLPDVIPEAERRFYWFNSISGSGPDDIWMSTKANRYLHWDGTALSVHDPRTQWELEALWARAKDDAWSTTIGGPVLRWDGARWQTQSPDHAYRQINALWGARPDDIWAAGIIEGPAETRARSLVLHWQGDRWQPVSIPDGSELLAIGGQDDELWVAGHHGRILHHGSDRTFAIEPAPTTADLRGLWSDRSGSAWIVGDTGTILRRDRGPWTLVASPVDVRLHGIWGAAPDDVWAVGDRGTILRWRGNGWQAVTSGTDRRLRGVWGTASDDVWAVGDDTILHWDGTRWSAVFAPTRISFASVHGTDRNDVWIVSDHDAGGPTIAHWDGNLWSVMTRTPHAFLRAVWAVAPDEAWAGGFHGALLRFVPP